MPSTSATTTDALAAIAAKVPCVLIGTAALRRLHPVALAGYTRAETDCDFLLRPEALLPLVAVVQAMGFVVTAWGEDWRAGWTLADVTGRFYVRATRGPLTIDATFECPFIDVDAAHREAAWLDGVPIAPEPLIWRLKWIKDAAKCQSFAEEHGLLIPASARSV
ncbi:MAG: hypothetical protein ACI8RZ_005316 [Myxococcota bacterium]